MSGEWIHRDVDIHRCDKPGYSHTVKTGDIWRCDECKTKWKVVGMESGMQWDPYDEPVLRWEIVHEHPVYTPPTYIEQFR